MTFLKKLLSGKQQPVKTYADFWRWFQQQEREFFKIVKGGKDIERKFFNPLLSRLAGIKQGYYCVTGMWDENTAELIFTAEGYIEHIVFVEELVAAAPQISGWKFTALKPALNIKDVNIRMNDIDFNKDKLFFCAKEEAGYPDEIDIVVVHEAFVEEQRSVFSNGVFVFLDNYLGELEFVTVVDNLQITGSNSVAQELIPIEKLKAYIRWRQKEFVEKYDGVRHETEDDNYAVLEAELKNGQPLLAVINTDLMQWDKKASHPWIMKLEISYGSKGNNGMPVKEEYDLMENIESELMSLLKDAEGYLNVGRETADNCRNLFLACKDFRKPSKVAHELQQKYTGNVQLQYEIFKDKYWRSLEKFTVSEGI